MYNNKIMLSYIPLVVIVILLLIYWIFAFIILYHLIRFGVGSMPKLSALIYFIGSLVLFFVVVIAYARVNATGLFDALPNILPF